ncbi:RICIN domain-containing protein [Amycolatopsis kentuckyensis]|uniref:RICIN domain-containing protein n=1 Tax=Amycolatopsis kentuckyensis TaxID=218823 RepID=UPI00313442F0
MRLPMKVALKAANDNANVSAVTYGPVVLAGAYSGSTLPSLNVGSITRTSSSALTFSATANGAAVNLVPFYDAQGFNYTVYWNTGGAGVVTYRLVNVGSGLVLGVENMSTADGGRALQWSDSGTADHNWEMITDGSAVRFRNANSGKVLGVLDMSTADGARVLQWSDNGTADHRWTIVDQGDGTSKVRNVNSGKLLTIENGSSAAGAYAVQGPDNGAAANRWRVVRNG